MTNFTNVVFTVDEDMACTLFQSCVKVSLIAQASIQSSISFLDFLVSFPFSFISFNFKYRVTTVKTNHYRLFHLTCKIAKGNLYQKLGLRSL